MHPSNSNMPKRRPVEDRVARTAFMVSLGTTIFVVLCTILFYHFVSRNVFIIIFFVFNMSLASAFVVASFARRCILRTLFYSLKRFIDASRGFDEEAGPFKARADDSIREEDPVGQLYHNLELHHNNVFLLIDDTKSLNVQDNQRLNVSKFEGSNRILADCINDLLDRIQK